MEATSPTLRHFSVFLSSPGEMQRERAQVTRFIESWNRAVGRHFRVCLDVVQWETDSTTGMGRPQALGLAPWEPVAETDLAVVYRRTGVVPRAERPRAVMPLWVGLGVCAVLVGGIVAGMGRPRQDIQTSV